MRYAIILISCSVVLLLSCKKTVVVAQEEPLPVNTELQKGLPETPAAINGYLYMKAYCEYFNSIIYNYNYLYGAFSDPERNLMNNPEAELRGIVLLE